MDIILFNCSAALLNSFKPHARKSISFCSTSLHQIRSVSFLRSTNSQTIGIVSDKIRSKLQSNLLSSSFTNQAGDLNYDVDIRVAVKNSQRKVRIDLEKIKRQTFEIQKVLGVEKFEIDILFCADARIRKMNEEWRGIKKPTDILSFPVYEFATPGIFVGPPVLDQEQKLLGDIVIAPNYCQKLIDKELSDQQKGIEYEDIEDDAGVSKAMNNMFSLDERLPLLMIHGVLHLLGYDHETDKDWNLMTAKEDEVLRALKDKGII